MRILILTAMMIPAVVSAGEREDRFAVEKTAAIIDAHFNDYWKSQKVQPAPQTTDAEFLRRVSLHISGKIAPVSKVRAFLGDKDRDKRLKLVDELLSGPGYVASFGKSWSRAWVPEVENDLQLRFYARGFESWVRTQLRDNRPYDEIVRDLLSTPFPERTGRQSANYFQTVGQPGPQLFYIARGAKPGDLAGATSRSFLGIRIGCAQCHDHPFDHWKQSNFWSFAAFFNGLDRRGESLFNPIREISDRREIAIPETEKVVQAAYLDGKMPVWKYKTSARVTLAEWVTSKKNPYFAKAAVNRVWGQFFGRGLVDPIDDFSEANPPSHPKLLDALAKEFAANDFDLKFLIRAITASKAYQLSSLRTDKSQDDENHFARFNVHAMSSEQLTASLVQAGSLRPKEAINPQFFVSGQGDARQELIDTFKDASESPTGRRATILQSLLMMNGQLIKEIVDPQRDGTLGGVVNAPFMKRPEKLRTLFYAALGRNPTEKEMRRMTQYITRSKDSPAAYSDVFWGLLNSAEFRVIH